MVSFEFKIYRDPEVPPVIEFISADWELYNSINSNLYLKLFKRSSALLKCTKFSKWYGISVSSMLEDTVLI